MLMKRGQASLEFLYSTAFSLSFLILVLIVLYQSQSDNDALSRSAVARGACNAIAAQITKVASAGDGASAQLFIPEAAQQFAIFISSSTRSISVSYENGGIGCSFATSNVSNGTAYSFYLTNNTMIRNMRGGVVIG